MKILAHWLGSGTEATLQGARIKVRPAVMEDFNAWVSLRSVSRAFLEPWEPKWDDHDLTRLAFRERVRRTAQLANEDSAYSYLIFDNTGQLLGGITLSSIRRGVAQMGSLGYWIGQPYRQSGYMKEAVMLVMDHAFGELALHRVEAACLPHNLASVRLLQSCGFQGEGLARRYLKINGKWEDHLLFARIAEDH